MKRGVNGSAWFAGLGMVGCTVCLPFHIAGALPLSASMQLTQVARADPGGPTVTDHESTSWGVPLSTLTNSSSATSSNNTGTIAVAGSGTATWTSANAGTVSFRDYGRTVTTPGGVMAGFMGSLAIPPDWQYTFVADATGTFEMTYDVTATGPFLGKIGLGGWKIEWSGPEGDDDLFYNALDPTASGIFSAAVIAGDTYTIGLQNHLNANGAMSTGSMNGDFDWDITASSTVPEPSSMLLLASAMLGLRLARRRNRTVQLRSVPGP